MTSSTTPVLLRGSLADDAPLRECSRGHVCSPLGGVDLSATRWVCASCWKSMNMSRRLQRGGG